MKDILKIAAGVALGLLTFSGIAIALGNLFLIGWLFGNDQDESSWSDLTTPTWTEISYSDPMNDTETVSIYIEENDANTLYEAPATLNITCSGDSLEAYIAWEEYIASDSLLAIRFNSGDVMNQRWILSPDETETHYPGSPAKFIHQMMNSDRLVARAKTYEGSTLTVVFTTSNLEEAYAPIRSACP